jgi:hypothetical protein
MTLEERIEMMEKDLKLAKRQKIISWIVVVAFFFVAIMMNPYGNIAAQSKHLDEIRATRIVLTDQNGMERAVLALDVDNGMVGLVMRDKHGGASAVLGTSGLNLRDENGKLRAVVAFDTDKGEPGLALFSQSGQARALLLVDKDGPALSLRDAKGNQRWFKPSPAK